MIDLSILRNKKEIMLEMYENNVEIKEHNICHLLSCIY